MQIDLSGRVVLVTGAGQGIGRSIAQAFSEEGASVVALDVVPAPLEDLQSRGAVTLGLVCDVTEPAQVRDTVDTVESRFGRIDVLINNAGINVEGPVETFDPAVWDRIFAVNVGGVFAACQAVIPAMKRQRSGRIINAASFAAVTPSVGAAAYSASKAAVVQLTRVLASELGPWGITVNSYAPGMIPSAMNEFAALDEESADAKLDQLSVRRWGTPEDVARLCLFLASDLSDYVTGGLLDVSGGKFATQDPGAAWRAAFPRPDAS